MYMAGTGGAMMAPISERLTLVGYMGVTALPQVVERLIEGGMDPETPAALVERIGGPEMAAVTGLSTEPIFGLFTRRFAEQ